MAPKPLHIGIAEAGIMHAVPDEFDLDTRFRMVREAGVFDYYDKTPAVQDVAAYQQASAKYGLPMTAGGFYYFLGRDEPLLEWHLRIGKDLGTQVHNVQIISHDVNRRPVTDEQVAEVYLRAAEVGDETGVTPCFEVHVNMWSEHFGRVARVAQMVERRGVPFSMTLDHSHVIFKIDNPAQQEVQGMRADVESGALVLDPFKTGSICQRWIDAGYVRHAHARAAVPNGPPNLWSNLPNGKPGRGIQYPFIRPGPGEWHSDWDEAKLAPWKEVVRQLLRHHAASPDSKLATISTEFIPFPDYGGGAKYSIFENSVACAAWLREEWAKALAGAEMSV
ncbi:MAG: sugar phosphate isomerase/epimerase family protein [Caulobacterales bacterium]